jgi:hypothetical protein
MLVWTSRRFEGDTEEAALWLLIMAAFFGFYHSLLAIFVERVRRLPTAELDDDPLDGYVGPMGILSIPASFCFYLVASGMFFPETTLKAFLLDSWTGFAIGLVVTSALVSPWALFGTTHLIAHRRAIRTERLRANEQPT